MQERVYQELRQALMRSYCPPGEVLIVRRLSNQFRTSHMPVRDALARLVAEQALEVLPSRSVAVSVLSRERWKELHEVRELLESRVAALSATRISARDIATLARLNRDMHAQAARRDAETYLATNWRFHFALHTASATRRLAPARR
jgi:DNA-binding GntR family transcriptional regulator